MDVEPPVMIWLPVSLQDQITVQITSCVTSVQELKLVHNTTADLLAALPSPSTCSLVICDLYWLPLLDGFSYCPVKFGIFLMYMVTSCYKATAAFSGVTQQREYCRMWG